MGAAPLAGVRLIELDGMGPVPLACRILAGMGAEVVRIARAGSVDRQGSDALLDNREVVRLDLKSSAGSATALDLIAKADGLIEGFRPGKMERLGLGPEQCHARNPALVYVRVTGWGQDGPLTATAGHDLNYLAVTGVLNAIGQADRPPPPPLNLIGDYGAGSAIAVIAMMGGLFKARASGRGEVFDVAMIDGIATLSSVIHAFLGAGQWTDDRESNLLDGGAPYYRCYACADGKFMAVGAIEPQFFAQLLDGLGIAPGLYEQRDRSQWNAMAADFGARFATRPRDEWIAVFEGSDACVAPVLNFAEARRHPQNQARGLFAEDLPASVPWLNDSRADSGLRGEIDAASVMERWAGANPGR